MSQSCRFEGAGQNGKLDGLMAVRRVFVESIEDDAAFAHGDSARHLVRSVRLRRGEQVEVSDQVRAYLAVTESCSPDEVRFRIEQPLPDPGPVPCLDAALAIIRFPRFEWAVEKLTELGVRSIIPVIAARSDVKLVSAASKRASRWQRIAFEAAQQSRRIAAPTVAAPTRFEQAVHDCPAGTGLLVHPGGAPLADAGRVASVFLVGPEGGWTDEEAGMATRAGLRTADLGRTILRSETAAVATAAVVSANRSGETSA